MENSKKNSLWELVFVLHFYSHLEVFPKVFLCDFDFQTLYILTLKLSYHPIY